MMYMITKPKKKQKKIEVLSLPTKSGQTVTQMMVVSAVVDMNVGILKFKEIYYEEKRFNY